MPAFKDDIDGLQSLVKDLRAIADILDRWSPPEGTETRPVGAQPYTLTEVTNHFNAILNELMESGADGHGVYGRLDAIGRHLIGAGKALGGD